MRELKAVTDSITKNPDIPHHLDLSLRKAASSAAQLRLCSLEAPSYSGKVACFLLMDRTDLNALDILR